MRNNTIVRSLIDYRNRIRSRKISRAFENNEIQFISENYNLSDVYQLKEFDRKLWTGVIEALEEYNLKKLQGKDKVKVAFVLYSSSMWSCDILYHLFLDDPRFEPYIIVSRYTLDADKTEFPTFAKSLYAIREMGYKVISIDKHTSTRECFAAMGEPDIIFYLTPYGALYPEGQNEAYMPAKTLCVYIPYSYMLVAAEGKYDSPGMTLSWRHFCDSQLYRKMLLHHSADYSRNTFFVGYPKMDIYYEPLKKSKSDIWKLPYGNNMKCIIYAPHHSLPGSKTCSAHFSTFDKNYRDILNYAKTHMETTTWIVKPHPNLKMTVLETGFFKSGTEYRNYLAEWDALPNAKVVEESTYYDMFMTSDAMICDSVSFLAEYQFTGKPLLLLTRPDNNFNEFGKKVAEILYRVPGTDVSGIARFIDNVVINGNDTMKETREMFFKECLDYRVGGKPSASQQIYEHIVEAIAGV